MLPAEDWLNRRYQIIAFDWDGTAVAGRLEDTTRLRGPLERLLVSGVTAVIVTGTKVATIDGQIASTLPAFAKSNLYVSSNRGSEIYGFPAPDGRPLLLHRRVATPEEDRVLTEVAETLRRQIVERTGLDLQVIYDRLNRRKVDLIPIPAWADPPKAAMPRLRAVVEQRLQNAGLARGLTEAMELAAHLVAERGLDLRITSDVKHIEIGLTDKADAMRWLLANVAWPRGISIKDILVLGDEFGPTGASLGSDARMMVPELRGATFVSVGSEPEGVPATVIHVGGGPARFREILSRQAALWPLELPASPSVAQDWRLVEEGLDLPREHEIESLFAVSNGYFGTRAALPERTRLSAPGTVVAGVFTRKSHVGAIPELAHVWQWENLRVLVGGQPLDAEHGSIGHRRILDMRNGILWRQWEHRDAAGRITRIDGLWFASQTNRHMGLASISIAALNHASLVRLESVLPHGVEPVGANGILTFSQRPPGAEVALAFAVADRVIAQDGTIVAAQVHGAHECTLVSWDFHAALGCTHRFERMMAVATSRESERPHDEAVQIVSDAQARGMEHEVRTHTAAWERNWQEMDLEIVGDHHAQRAVRFAMFHLVSAANPQNERVSIGARSLSGGGYKGHIFWDTEIYMLPFFLLTNPTVARALLMYRYHTLRAARAKAAALGLRGALYAWESADTGEEVTPPLLLGPDGLVVPVYSRDQEHHISADVAYGVWSYWRATLDERFLQDAGAEIVFETARFWASRVAHQSDGLFHILGVVGPDEYHDSVDDNAYTNVMAQWNLERGAELARFAEHRWPRWWREISARLNLAPHEPDRWAEIAAAMYTGFDPASGLIEQFRGFFALDEVDLQALEPRTAPVDMILGRERTRRSQAVKQADVVLLLYLLWDRFPSGVHETNFRYYEPRTAHGSSLSPSIYALVAARLGLMDKAEQYFRQAADIDLANNMGNSGGGVHAAALGGLWQSVVFGFAGLWTDGDQPRVMPHLPAQWSRVRFAIRWRKERLPMEMGLPRAASGWSELREATP